MARWLVTGGCGFIGSHLCAELIADGHHVRVLDNLSTGHRGNLAAGATLIVGDISDPQVTRMAMRGMDGCFHLAAVASVERCNNEWFDSHKVNLSGMVALLDAARRESELEAARPPVRVVYASSAAVYGTPDQIPVREESSLRPMSAYGADKLGCELHARVASAVHGVPSAGLRFFNVFGPRQDPKSPYSGVISIFCERLVRGEQIQVYGDGEQTRDFVYVGDVVTALIAAMENASCRAPVYNVCTGRPTTVLELAAGIGRVCGKTPVIEHKPSRRGEIRHSVGLGARARQELGFTARTTLEQGLRQVVSWLLSGSPELVLPAGMQLRKAAMAVREASEIPVMMKAGRSRHVRIAV